MLSLTSVCSFEMFEHVQDVARLLTECQRVLKPSGVLLITTPNVHSYVAAGHNPYHVKEYTFQEFRDLLSQYFPEVTVFGQFCQRRVREASLPSIILALFPLDSLPQADPEFRSTMHLSYGTGNTAARCAVEELGQTPFLPLHTGACRASRYFFSGLPTEWFQRHQDARAMIIYAR